MTVWFAIVVGHFLLCARIGHWLGSPNKLPASMKGVDELFSHGLSGGLDLLLIAAWWVIVSGLLIGLAVAVAAVSTAFPLRYMSAVIDGMLYLTPVAGLTVLVLLILPMYGHVEPSEPSGLELAEMMPFDAYLETLYTGLFAIVTIVVLFGGLFLAAALFDTFLPDGGAWQLIVAILFGITLAMVFGFLAGPFVLKISQQYGATRAITGFLAVWALITSGPTMLVARSK